MYKPLKMSKPGNNTKKRRYTTKIQHRTKSTTNIEKNVEMKQSTQETAEDVLRRKLSKNKKNDMFDQRCDEARRGNEARIRCLGTRKTQDRREYQIKRNTANTISREQKHDWVNRIL